ncbi:TolC family protein [Paraferrimonas sp. SM1919]|uniref:TolC family protein n=1 Tax=Paraferrimonas sp. SM1919 TaxID=2662263 RepID=UPI0013D387F6|nr:TolC family protein [Paraferrimonas sp. SM1919]
MQRFKKIISLFLTASLSTSVLGNSLSEVVEKGLNNNLTLAASQAGVEEFEYNLKISQSNFLPSINGSALKSWNRDNTQQHEATDINKKYTDESLSLSFKQKIINLEDIYKYQSTKEGVTIEKLRNQNKIQATIEDIAIQYIELMKKATIISATKKELMSSNSRLKQMSRNIEVGNSPKNDIYEVISKNESIKQKIATLEKEYLVTKSNIENLIQYPIDANFTLKENVSFSNINEKNIEKYTNLAMANNKEIAIALKSYQKAMADIKTAASKFSPTLTLNGSISKDYTSDFDLLNNPSSTGKSQSKSIDLQLNIPITSGGSDFYEYKKNKQKIKKLQLELQSTRSSIKNSIKVSILNINNLAQSISSLRLIVEANRSSFNGLKKAYELGTRTLTDLLLSETKLFNSYRDYNSARYDYTQELIMLERMTGSLSIDSINKMDNFFIASELTEQNESF